MAGQGGRVTVPETNNQRARCGRLFRRDPWAHRPQPPRGCKRPGAARKKEGGGTGRGDGETGAQDRGRARSRAVGVRCQRHTAPSTGGGTSGY